MRNKELKKLNLHRNVISKLQSIKIKGGVHDSCTPQCVGDETKNILCIPTNTK
ncbi:hypothetical protein [Aquimarina sp. AU474]|uniref:hypothetical protein n=1 Tax=Aquimarina sp. AU474 TaxID=2108529 RepID=UPI00135ABFC3|nr:hypothetical protein [Aquimarina sp. AU474]